MNTQPTYAIAVQFFVKPEHIGAFLKRVVQQAEDSLSKETGCLQFDVLVDQVNPNLVFLYETYADEAAFEAHRSTPHFSDFQATIAQWFESKQVLRLNTIHSSVFKAH